MLTPVQYPNLPMLRHRETIALDQAAKAIASELEIAGKANLPLAHELMNAVRRAINVLETGNQSRRA